MPLHHYLPAAFLASFSSNTSTVPRRNRLLCAVEPGADYHQAAQAVIAPKSHASVNAVHPDVDVVSFREVPPHEVLPLGLPALCEAGDGGRVEAESPASVPKNSSKAGTKSPLESPCR